MILFGKVTKGYGIARNTISLQKIFFKKKIKDIDDYKDGTINITLDQVINKYLQYDIYFKDVNWDHTGIYPSEDFGLIKVNKIIHKDKIYLDAGYIYIPTKSPHYGKSNYLEIIGYEIKNLEYSDNIELNINDKRIELI